MFLKDFIVVVMVKPTFSPLVGESEGSRPAVYTNDLPGGAAEGCDWFDGLDITSSNGP